MLTVPPPYISTSDEGSFAQYTLYERMPQILKDVIQDNPYDLKTVNRLALLLTDVSGITIDRLHHEEPTLWEVFYSHYEGRKLSETPFFFAEMYFYALINEVVLFNFTSLDPFSAKKRKDIKDNLDFFHTILDKSEKESWITSDYVQLSLKGNRADLSQIKKPSNDGLTLLIDDTYDLIDVLQNTTEVHVILDNAGVELFTDLLLAMHIHQEYQIPIKLHIKAEPLLVSDTIQSDVDELLYTLKKDGHEAFVQEFQELLENGAITISSSHYWNAPCHFNELEEVLQLSTSSLILSKGDANYRRFFEDRKWPLGIASASIVDYLPCPAFAIRTLKSEIQTGLSQTQTALISQPSNWMTNGQFAIIQHLNA